MLISSRDYWSTIIIDGCTTFVIFYFYLVGIALLLCKMISTQIKRRKKSAKLQYYWFFFVSSLYYIRLRPIIQLPYLAAEADGLLVLGKTFGNISNPWPRQFEIWILQHISISCSKGGQGCYLVSTIVHTFEI